MSSTKRSKVVRTESILDEYKIYSSHVLSPFKKKKKQPNVERKSAAKVPQLQQHYGGNRVTEYRYENVDDEAEKFIRKKQQKFELSLWKY
uniref:Uncharacterized protein n=1 Tax=Chenopodium quinoa TaxID=63459 RepID=A0A803L0U4_CHEQI